MARPKAILFDLDGTLFDRDGTVRELLQAQYRQFGADLAHVPGETYVRRLLELDAHGYVDKELVYREAAADFALSDTLAQRLREHFWDSLFSLGHCYPEVAHALVCLRASGFKLGIITNGAVRVQERKIRQLGLEELFDTVLISEREGLRKPDPRIFERAVGRLGIAANAAWYVGDHPVTDVRGAFAAGLTAIWRYTPHWPPPDVPAREIQGLDELVELAYSTTRGIAGIEGSGAT